VRFELFVELANVPDTNLALKHHWGAAYCQGIADAHAQKCYASNRYADNARLVRGVVAARARGGVPVFSHLDLVSFAWWGYDNWDADGGILAGKWALDGLRDAGVVPNDRRAVFLVSSAVIREVRPFGVRIVLDGDA
jgi:hypothetical protein